MLRARARASSPQLLRRPARAASPGRKPPVDAVPRVLRRHDGASIAEISEISVSESRSGACRARPAPAGHTAHPPRPLAGQAGPETGK